MISAAEALVRLREGNERFARDAPNPEPLLGHAHREDLLDGQAPFAIILGCSDSRVPAELVFDQGIGTLFVIRVAGNIVAPSLVGSVEFAAAHFSTRLVVVLGHTRCGVIDATIQEVLHGGSAQTRNIRSIVNRIRPSVEPLLETHPSADRDALMHHAVRANVRASVNHLRHGSELIELLIATEGLRVVGAEYSLESGAVDFFDTDDL